MCLIVIQILLRAVVPMLNWPICVSCYSQFKICTRYPQTINERWSKFFKLIGSILDQSLMNAEDLEDESRVKIQLNVDRLDEESMNKIRKKKIKSLIKL